MTMTAKQFLNSVDRMKAAAQINVRDLKVLLGDPYESTYKYADAEYLFNIAATIKGASDEIREIAEAMERLYKEARNGNEAEAIVAMNCGDCEV
ncbi:MAG: hypothetical protein ACI4SV_02235 [Duodenibacillus sp.]